MSITNSPEYIALADKARLGTLSEVEKVQWKQFQQNAQAEKTLAEVQATNAETLRYQQKRTLLMLRAAPAAQATVLSAPPAPDQVASETAATQEAARRRRILATQTLFSNRNSLGGAPSPVGGANPSLGGVRTLLS